MIAGQEPNSSARDLCRALFLEAVARLLDREPAIGDGAA